VTQHSEQSGHRIAFVCVQNAGRSQMAAAFAEQERDRRGVGDRIEIVTGGTQPADHVHDIVVEAMAEVDIDISDRTPREVTPMSSSDRPRRHHGLFGLGRVPSDVERREP